MTDCRLDAEALARWVAWQARGPPQNFGGIGLVGRALIAYRKWRDFDREPYRKWRDFDREPCDVCGARGFVVVAVDDGTFGCVMRRCTACNDDTSQASKVAPGTTNGENPGK